MKLDTIVFVLSAALIATPALANWFDNTAQGENHKKLLGGTPSPTPDDLRAIGDSKLGEGRSYYFEPKDGHWHEDRSSRTDRAAGSAPLAGAAKIAPASPVKP